MRVRIRNGMGPAKAKSRGTVSRKIHYTVKVRNRDVDQKFGRDETNETREVAATVLVPSRSRQNGSFRKLQIDELPVSIDKTHRATDTWGSFVHFAASHQCSPLVVFQAFIDRHATIINGHGH